MNVKYYVRALLCLYITILLPIYNVHAQALKVGDTLPPELWSMPLQVVNHPEGKETISLSEYKDKLIILDFWATWCGPCIAMLPKQDSLQKRFTDKVQILPVTYQSAEEVKSFMEKYTNRKGIHINLPEVVNNQTLKSYFEHGTIPHYVWIKDGELKAITSRDEIVADKILAFLDGQEVSMKAKSQVPRLGYQSTDLSLLEFLAHNKPELLNDFSFRSTLSRNIPGLGSVRNITRPKEGSPVFRITFTNLPPMHLYQLAFGEGTRFVNYTSIVVESSDSLRIKQPDNLKYLEDWISESTYCYELIVPGARSSEVYKIFREQLTVLFPTYKAVVEYRNVPVLALERIENTPLKVSSATKLSESYDGFTYQFSGGSPSTFVIGLDGMYLYGSSKPVVDMTGFEGKIDLKLEANMGSVSEINAALRPYGLILSDKMATIPILVIRDNQ